jgi:hypothetical protein
VSQWLLAAFTSPLAVVLVGLSCLVLIVHELRNIRRAGRWRRAAAACALLGWVFVLLVRLAQLARWFGVA